MTDLKKVLAQNMKFHRKKLGYTQANLAEKVNVSNNHIALIETGRRFPSINILEQLASALKIDVLELFSIKITELEEKKETKDAIMTDIDKILTHRLIGNK